MSPLRAVAFLVLLSGWGLPALSHADANAVRILKHDMKVSIDPATHRLAVLDRVTLEGTAPESKEIAFTLNKALVVAWVSREGTLLPFRPRPLPAAVEAGAGLAHHIVVRLDRPVRSHETFTLDFDYAGALNDPPKEPRHLRFVTPSETSGHIGPEGAYIGPETWWYPDLPDSLASYRVTVATPAGWEAIGQGRLLAREATASETITTWEAATPAEGLTLTAGKFVIKTRKSGGVEIATYLYPEDAALADEYLTAAVTYLEAYSALLGPYPFARFSIVENFFAGGLGMPSYTLLGAGSIRRHYTQPYALGHEIVHSWIGNHVFNDGAGNWVEGLTTYLSNYYWHELKGDLQKAREERRMMLFSYAVYVTPDQDYPVARFTRKSDPRDNAIGYNKAAMVFHMLRREMGDERFFTALKNLVAAHGNTRAGWRDLEGLFSRAAGRDLRAFFARWIEQPGAADVPAGSDQDFHVFRRIPRRDLPPMLNLFTTDPRRLVVLQADDAKTVTPYRELAERITQQDSAVGLRSVAGVRAADFQGASVLLLGGPLTGPAFDWAKRGIPGGVELRPDGFRVGGKEYTGNGMALLLSFRHPDDPDHVVSVFYGFSQEAVMPVARLLFFYGWNSYVIFEHGKVVARGDEK